MAARKHGLRPSLKGGARRLLGVAATLAVVGSGLMVSSSPALAAPDPAAAGSCSSVNPMGAATPTNSEDGYTLFVREDAIFANSELEGTLAVGDTATFGDPRGNGSQQYPIMHGGVGGNLDYSVPTIGGQPNRVLIQQFAAENKVVQVKATGATGSNAEAGAKIGDQSTPAGYTFGPMFGGSGTTFFPIGGGNMSPQIDSVVQPWADLSTAQDNWGIDSDVLSYFPVDNGAAAIQSFDDWSVVAAPTGDDQTVTLSGDKPSKLLLSDFAGISKFKLADYSETSFLIITVNPADIVNGRVTLPSYSFAGKDSAEKEGISHILFDFSAISGEVEVVSPNEPVRGSLYAPNAHIVFPAESDGGREFEGQLIAQNFTALQGGKEMHTNLFKGRFPCSDQPTEDEGTFNLQKVLSGIDAAQFPAGTTFPVTAVWDGGEESFDLPADGTVVPSGLLLPAGTVVTLTEGDLPEAPEGYSFVSTGLSADTVTILADGNTDIAWTVTNTYVENVVVVEEGTLNLRKILSGIDAAQFPAGTTFPVTAVWDGGEKSFDLPADGTVVPSGLTLPAGTVVTLSEGDLPEAPEGYSFVSTGLSADTVTILADGNTDIAWTVTNTYVENVVVVEEGTLNLRKILSGIDAAQFPAGTTFPVTAVWDGGEKSFDLPADGTVVPSGVTLPAGTVVTLTEGDLPEAPEGYSFVSTGLSADTVTILADGNTDIAWTVTNTYSVNQTDQGGFDLTKTLKGVSAKDFPTGTVFTVVANWTIDGSEVVREYELPVDGSTVVGPRDLPAGTVVVFSEVNVPKVDGYAFTGVEFTPESLTIQSGDIAQVEAVNTYKRVDLAVTGGTVASGVVLMGALFLVAGGAVLLFRRKRTAS